MKEQIKWNILSLGEAVSKTLQEQTTFNQPLMKSLLNSILILAKSTKDLSLDGVCIISIFALNQIIQL